MEQVFSHTVRITIMAINRARIVLRKECLMDTAVNPIPEVPVTAIAPILRDIMVHLNPLVWHLALEEKAIWAKEDGTRAIR